MFIIPRVIRAGLALAWGALVWLPIALLTALTMYFAEAAVAFTPLCVVVGSLSSWISTCILAKGTHGTP